MKNFENLNKLHQDAGPKVFEVEATIFVDEAQALKKVELGEIKFSNEKEK